MAREAVGLGLLELLEQLEQPCSSSAGSRPRELRERLKPELLELIQQQRLLHLCEGTLFRKISSRRRQGECQPSAPGRGSWARSRGLSPHPLPLG